MEQQKAALLAENESYEKELAELREEAHKIEQEEKEYWDSIASYERKLIETERESSKIDNLLTRIGEEKARVENLDVLGDLFKIKTDGPIGTINGYLLGCEEDEKVGFCFPVPYTKNCRQKLKKSTGQ